jgi:hypothetical protein
MASVRHQLNTAAVQALLVGPQGAVAKDMLKRGLLVESRAKQNLQRNPHRVDTGRLRASIRTTFVMIDGKPAVRVGTSVRYAIYVHDGTGLYGPRHRMIVPVNKKVLRWRPKGAGKVGKGGFVYSMRSRGMRPNPFLRDAIMAAKY